MSCLALLLLTAVIIYFGGAIAFFVGIGSTALAALALVLIPLALLFIWRIVYPWLVRMGRWSAQLRNIAFLAFILLALGMGIGFIIDVPRITIPYIDIEVPITVLAFGLILLFLLLLGLVVWLVRIWRRGWPTIRDLFWDIYFRTVALFWKILVGIPLGITWFFYHPPLRWFVAALIFYLRGVSAAAAWLLYNPPLNGIAFAIVVVSRFVGRIVAFLIYNPPIRWVIEFGIFCLRLIARISSSIIYHIWSWWPITGVKGTLRKGLNTESKSYQDYKYA